MSQEDMMSALSPLFEILATVDLSDAPAAQAKLNQELPLSDPRISKLKELFAEGKKAGWLCDKSAGNSSFSRVAKPSDETKNFSIDAVALKGQGMWHKHTEGEIDLCFAADMDPRFDGHPEGWVVFAPGSAHIPEVTGGRMDILYFLPNGAVEWKKPN